MLLATIREGHSPLAPRIKPDCLIRKPVLGGCTVETPIPFLFSRFDQSLSTGC